MGRRGGPSDQLPGSCPCWSVKERQRGHGMTEWAVAMIDGAATLRVLAVFRQQPARWAPWSHPRPSSRTRLSGAGGVRVVTGAKGRAVRTGPGSPMYPGRAPSRPVPPGSGSQPEARPAKRGSDRRPRVGSSHDGRIFRDRGRIRPTPWPRLFCGFTMEEGQSAPETHALAGRFFSLVAAGVARTPKHSGRESAAPVGVSHGVLSVFPRSALRSVGQGAGFTAIRKTPQALRG